MEIKDYIHLYFPCQVVTKEEGDSWLIGITDRSEIDSGGFEEQPPYLILLDGGEEVYRNAEDFKLALRPLSDITEEEAKGIAALCLGDVDFIITYSGMGYPEADIHESVKCFKIETFCLHPDINTWIPSALLQIDHEEGDIIIGRFSNMGRGLKDDLIAHPYELTKYLLKQKFDLFGLLDDKKLAIDKTKI